jgi:hypothetical protein
VPGALKIAAVRPGTLVSGVLVQWLIDPGRAPSPAELALGLQAIADQVTAAKPG